MTKLNEAELSKISGGIGPLAIPVAAILGFLATDTWSHADELVAESSKDGNDRNNGALILKRCRRM